MSPHDPHLCRQRIIVPPLVLGDKCDMDTPHPCPMRGDPHLSVGTPRHTSWPGPGRKAPRSRSRWAGGRPRPRRPGGRRPGRARAPARPGGRPGARPRPSCSASSWCVGACRGRPPETDDIQRSAAGRRGPPTLLGLPGPARPPRSRTLPGAPRRLRRERPVAWAFPGRREETSPSSQQPASLARRRRLTGPRAPLPAGAGA